MVQDIRFHVVRGRTQKITIQAKDADGDPVPLVSVQIWFTAKKSYGDADEDAVFKKGLGSGITVTDATNGIYEVSILPSDTTPLANTVHTLVYDSVILLSTGEVGSVLAGPLMVYPSVTEDYTA